MALNKEILNILKEGVTGADEVVTKPVVTPYDKGSDYSKGVSGKQKKRKGDKELGDDADGAKTHKPGVLGHEDVDGPSSTVKEEKDEDTDSADTSTDDDKKKDSKDKKKKSKNPFVKEDVKKKTEDDDDKDEDDEKDMSEDVSVLFAGEELTETFKKKAVVIFETAVNLKVEAKTKELQEQFDEALSVATVEIEESLEDKVNTFLSYVTEEWTKEHNLAIESSIRTEIAESFIGGLKSLFEQHSIEIPETKVDLVQKLSEQVAELRNTLTETLKSNSELKESINVSKRSDAINETVKGLPASQADKLKTLAESLSFGNVDSFKEKLGILKESFITKKTGNSALLTEELVEEDLEVKPVKDTRMNSYLQVIKNSNK